MTDSDLKGIKISVIYCNEIQSSVIRLLRLFCWTWTNRISKFVSFSKVIHWMQLYTILTLFAFTRLAIIISKNNLFFCRLMTPQSDCTNDNLSVQWLSKLHPILISSQIVKNVFWMEILESHPSTLMSMDFWSMIVAYGSLYTSFRYHLYSSFKHFVTKDDIQNWPWISGPKVWIVSILYRF